MRRLIGAVVATAVLALALALPAGAAANTLWICNVPGEGDVTFVSAADAALHGITKANAKAGAVFHTQFGEVCRVESG
jgi:ABC-type sugar transport system substrate-binding protein